jgi:UDP-N-acetylglucosamine 2-epimerase (non-hydrolysing)
MLKVVVAFGTRPEAIKLAPLVKKLKAVKEIEVIVCSTGQHNEMLDQVLRFFSIQPDYNFRVMRDNQRLTQVCADVICETQKLLSKHQPTVVVVQGDTTSALAIGLAAFYEGVPVAHVEAGLRTYDLSAPFPEEGNRQMVSRLAALHFAPTSRNRDALIAEGVVPETIYVTGNTVIDSLLWTVERLQAYSASHFPSELTALLPVIKNKDRLILVTGHRRESFGPGLEAICRSLLRIAKENPSLGIVYPVHLNPNISCPVRQLLGTQQNIYLLPPLSYPAFVWLMMNAYIIITDSGGIQEEAPSLKRPVLVTRCQTERQEAVEAGTVRIVGFEESKIVSEVQTLLSSPKYYADFVSNKNPYGDGTASEKIAQLLISHFSEEVGRASEGVQGF